MNWKRSLWFLMTATALVGAPLTATGCAGGSGSARAADLTPGEMPSGASWTGVYFSELYGYLHLVQDGNAVIGKWLRPDKDKLGRDQGRGDRRRAPLRVDRAHRRPRRPEREQDAARATSATSAPPGDNVDDTFAGEIGFDKTRSASRGTRSSSAT